MGHASANGESSNCDGPRLHSVHARQMSKPHAALLHGASRGLIAFGIFEAWHEHTKLTRRGLAYITARLQSHLAPATTALTSGSLQQLADLLQLGGCSRDGGLVIDLMGAEFGGRLRGRPPYRLVLPHANTVLRNGVLELPGEAGLVVSAPGCRFEGVTFRGAGFGSSGGLRGRNEAYGYGM